MVKKNTMSNKEFYIGYLPKMPPKLAKVIKASVALFFAVAISLAVVFVVGQKPFAKSFFEFGNFICLSS